MDQQGHHVTGGWTAGEDDAPRLRVPKTAELVANHFREQIVSGELFAGEFLPSEGLLTDALGIARPTLREALRILETEGLIAVTRGARTGAQVLRPSIDPVARHVAMLLRARQVTAADLYAARLTLEPDAVRTLAAAPHPGAMVVLRDQRDRVRATLAAGALDTAISQLNRFHVMLVEGAGNRTIGLFAAVLRRLMAAQQRAVGTHRLPSADQRRTHVAAALDHSTTLLTLIEAGDADTAVAHWRAYLTRANAACLAAVEGERVVELPAAR